jgi:hypothetical protein
LNGRDREALDDHLHAQELQLPEVGGEDLVEQRLQERIDRIDLVELLDVALEHLDVPPLVDDLRGSVELRVELGNGVHELAADDQGALFAVEELGQAPGRNADLDFLALFGRELREEVRAHERHLHVEHRPLGADGTAPVDGR